MRYRTPEEVMGILARIPKSGTAITGGNTEPYHCWFPISESMKFRARFYLRPLFPDLNIRNLYGDWDGLDKNLLEEREPVSKTDQLENLKIVLASGLYKENCPDLPMVLYFFLLISDHPLLPDFPSLFPDSDKPTEEDISRFKLELTKLFLSRNIPKTYYPDVDWEARGYGQTRFKIKGIESFQKQIFWFYDSQPLEKKNKWINDMAKVITVNPDNYKSKFNERLAKTALVKEGKVIPLPKRILFYFEPCPAAFLSLVQAGFFPDNMTATEFGIELIRRNIPKALSEILEAGLIKNRKQVETLLERARILKNQECVALLLDYLNRHYDLEKAARQKEAREMRELMAAPDSAYALKKIWTCSSNGDNTLRISGYKGEETDLAIPEKIGRKTVTELNKRAFSPKYGKEEYQQAKKNIRSILIPNSVQIIGDECFAGCKNLEYLIFSKNTAHFGDYCIEETGLSWLIFCSPVIKRVSPEPFRDYWRKSRIKILVPEDSVMLKYFKSSYIDYEGDMLFSAPQEFLRDVYEKSMEDDFNLEKLNQLLEGNPKLHSEKIENAHQPRYF